MRRVQVVIKHPACRRLLIVIGVMSMGLFDGVGAQQVVKREPARAALGYQVRPCQLGQRGAQLLGRQCGQAGRSLGGRVRPGMQPSRRKSRAACGLSCW